MPIFLIVEDQVSVAWEVSWVSHFWSEEIVSQEAAGDDVLRGLEYSSKSVITRRTISMNR